MSDPQPTASTQTSEAPPASRPSFVDRLSDALQNAIKVLIGSNRKPPRLFKTLLHGTWLRHPLHPAITDVPIGAWTGAVVFDILWLISPQTVTFAPKAAFVAVIIGFAAALGAFVTGSADWSDTYGAERNVGLLHGLMMTAAIILFGVSGVLRLQMGGGDNVLAAVLGFVGLADVLVAAYFGGDMVFHKGTGVNHTAWEAGGENFEAVIPVTEAAENKLYRVTVTGVPVLLVKLHDQYAAIAATCTHAGGPLDEGELQGNVVQCPWHGSRFALKNGAPLTGPATMAAPRYDVRIRDGQIELKRHGGH
jgi:nitrite reductase/ring-hydroxylating ferredoxin subunit/uncharacterized membrane protein